ncbi:MAG: hypothetical protein ACYCO0_00210 [Candidatus Micrarchaeaceae archaeon]
MATSMQSVKSKMACYPALKPLSDGTSPKYISIESPNDRFYVFQFEKDSIKATLNSTTSPSYFLKETITRLLGISMFLSDDYKIDFYGLMPYLAFVLVGKDIKTVQTNPPNFNRESDLLLSRRIIELSNKNNDLTKEAAALNLQLTSILSKLIIHKYNKNLDPQNLATELGIERQMITRAINLLRELGYTAVNSNGKSFDIVET